MSSSGDTLFGTDHLARRDDPDTSKAAARSLDLSRVPDDVFGVLEWVEARYHHGKMATYDEMAIELADSRGERRTEPARRALRTAIENHGLMERALDDSGAVITRENESGRDAECWRVTGKGRMEIARRRA